MTLMRIMTKRNKISIQNFLEQFLQMLKMHEGTDLRLLKMMPKNMKRKDVSNLEDMSLRKLKMTKQDVEFVKLTVSDLLLT